MSDKTPKSKVYLNYIDGSKLKKYEFNLNDPNEIRQYNQALKLDEDKRNTYLMLLAKKKLNTHKETDTVYHPLKLSDKRYDLSHNVYIQEEEKEELKKIKENKTRLSKERLTATEERKRAIDNEMKDLETREKIIEKNLETEYDKDFDTPSSSKSSSKTSTNPFDSKTTKEILKILKAIDDKYGSKLATIGERLEKVENIEGVIKDMKDEAKKYKDDLIDEEKGMMAMIIEKFEETQNVERITSLFNAKLKSATAELKSEARKIYKELSPPNKIRFVRALPDNITKKEQINAALNKSVDGSLYEISTLLKKNPLTMYLIPLFGRYWDQIKKTNVVTSVIKYFGSNKTEKLLNLWQTFTDNKDKEEKFSAHKGGYEPFWKYEKGSNRLRIYIEFSAVTLNEITKKLNIWYSFFDEIMKNWEEAFDDSDIFNFVISGKIEYPSSLKHKGKSLQTMEKSAKEKNVTVNVNDSKKQPTLTLTLSCNNIGATCIFMNGISIDTLGNIKFTPKLYPITIFGHKIDIKNPIPVGDKFPLDVPLDVDVEKEEKEEDSEEIDIDDLKPKEGEENPSEMEELEGLGAMEDSQSVELIKSELQTIKSLLFTIIYKLNKKDKDKYNKKNNNKSGNIDWLFD